MVQIRQKLFKKMQPRRLWVVITVCGLLCTAAWGGYRYWRGLATYNGSSLITVDMRKPSVVLRTQNLADVPKDIADAPLLKGLVDAQLAFYYEEDADRLSLEGSLRRMAYEHELRIEDRFLSSLMAAPAEVGFWQSSKGRPEYFVASIERSALSTVAETLAKIALSDGQLKLVKKFSIAGKSLPMYTLSFGSQRTLALVVDAQRWVILSHPELALDTDNDLTSDAQDVLSKLFKGQHPWQKDLTTAAVPTVGQAKDQTKHSLVLGRGMLSLGYAHFLPAVSGLRLDFQNASWQPQLRVDAASLPPGYALPTQLQSLWLATPARPAFCTAQVVNWQAAAEPLGSLVKDKSALKAALGALDPLVAVCWFAESRLNSPLFIAQSNTGLSQAATQSLLQELAQKIWAQSGELKVLNGTADSHKEDTAHITAQVPSGHGPRKLADGLPGFTPTLVQQGRFFYFSPDQRNVDAALAVAQKRAPALGDALPAGTWFSYDPKRLAQLVRAEVSQVLPSEEESYFRDIARNQLWPRLEVWGQTQRTTNAVLGRNANDGFAPLALQAAKAGVAP